MAHDELLAKAEKQLECMHVADALRLFHSAEEANHDPDACAAGRWTCHMLSGNFELAWRESDAIARRAKPDPNRFWDGRPLNGRNVLLRCLHGLGDTIQFIRYAPLIREKARTLVIEAQPRLKPLLMESEIADHVFTWGEPEPHWDQQVEIIELPRIFRTTVEAIPNRVPYLNVRSDPSRRPSESSRPLRVGVVWTSSGYNPARSISIEHLAGVFATPGVRFFSLQGGSERTQIQDWPQQVTNLCDETVGVLATAQAVKTLDLVITVDTMMAHLAGALARPVWTLLPFECDWRWMLEREDSPWYPTMRLFRQPTPGDWRPVMERAKRELQALVRMAENRSRDCRIPQRRPGQPLVQEA